MSTPVQASTTVRSAAIAAAATAVAACGTSVAPSFDDPVPEARLGAIAQSGPRPASDDRLRHLVECLSSDDAAVRLAAIGELRRSTGETLGYRFDDTAEGREAAIGRWRDRLAKGGMPG